jgi:hypothetical protein
MDNIILIGKTEYKLEKIWRESKNDNKRDFNGKLFPFPKEGIKWGDIEQFLNRLKYVNKYMELIDKFKKYEKEKDCLICGEKNVATKRYIFNNIIWEDSLEHYIRVHNIEPNMNFKDFIYENQFILTKQMVKTYKHKKFDIHLAGEIVKEFDKTYIKLGKNQIHILDALMVHGGYRKRYSDEKFNFHYSEHSGALDLTNKSFIKVIISAKEKSIDSEDNEIYLPGMGNDITNSEYIFHTHPPTPKPGGRVTNGILYEIPSSNDIIHFIGKYNSSKIIGSIVVAAEGLYCIRKNSEFGKKKKQSMIEVDEDELFHQYENLSEIVQKEAIKKYGYFFKNNKFFVEIANDVKYISKINQLLKKFNIVIDYYPRKKDANNFWIIDTIFLPI